MKLLYSLIFVLAIFTIYSCKKEGSYFPDSGTGNKDTSSVYSYSSLVATPDTIPVGQIVDIYANATGKNLVYTWSSSHAEIFGSGYHIQCSAEPCCIGNQKITCIVSDGVHSVTKYVVFNVSF